MTSPAAIIATATSVVAEAMPSVNREATSATTACTGAWAESTHSGRPVSATKRHRNMPTSTVALSSPSDNVPASNRTCPACPITSANATKPTVLTAWRQTVNPAAPDKPAVRAMLDAAGRIDAREPAPGMMAAVDFGRGPTGLRLSGTWARVGSKDGLAQYTGELTLDFGGRSPIAPVFGAGFGLARVARDGADTSGANVGVAVVRGGVAYRLPLELADARAELGVTGTLPAIRGEGAPDLGPWVLVGATIGIGL